jgi:radical SAM superfamily enzyme YgiQ (UPF0313 family)
LDKIIGLDPDWIISLTASVSRAVDHEFIKNIKAKKYIPVIGTGDFLLETPAQYLRKDWFDAVILDFSSLDILYFLEGKPDKVKSVSYIRNDEIIEGEVGLYRGEYEIPRPQHELFPLKKYRYPFVRHSSFATVLTDYGCPFHCSFCLMNTLGYKYRTVPNVMNELKFLKTLGIREIYFADQTFGAHKERGIELCQEMIKEGLNFGWVCFSRVDLTDDKVLGYMKRAGCHTIMYGVENARNNILKNYKKNITTDQTRETFARCRKFGLRTVATFLLGLPEEDRDNILETINFAQELGPNYVSFNMAIPKARTTLRDIALKNDLIIDDGQKGSMDQAGNTITMRTHHLVKEELSYLIKKANRDFYLRPSYLIRRLMEVRSPFDLKNNFLQGLFALRRLFFNHNNNHSKRSRPSGPKQALKSKGDSPIIKDVEGTWG